MSSEAMIMWFIVIPLMLWGFIVLVKYVNSESGLKQNKKIEEKLDPLFSGIASLLIGVMVILLLWYLVGALAGLGTTTLILIYIAYQFGKKEN